MPLQVTTEYTHVLDLNSMPGCSFPVRIKDPDQLLQDIPDVEQLRRVTILCQLTVFLAELLDQSPHRVRTDPPLPGDLSRHDVLVKIPDDLVSHYIPPNLLIFLLLLRRCPNLT